MYLISGMVLNHMNIKGCDGYDQFVRGLSQLAPILGQLSKITRIVWMQQAPVLANTRHFLKIHHYNAVMRTILK
jgi:hypothetical protein